MSESVTEVFHAILKNNTITIYPKETHMYLKIFKIQGEIFKI